MELAGSPAFSQGADLRNPDFALFAQACGARGFRVNRPGELRETIAEALAVPGPVIVDVRVDASELPSMPRIEFGQLWKFGIAKLRELAGS